MKPNLYPSLLSLLILPAFSYSAKAHTTLDPDDIDVTEIKLVDLSDDNSGNDEISLVLLTDYADGTKFVVTKDEVADGTLTTNEGRLETTAYSTVPLAVCQDITVEIDADGNPTTNGQPFTAADLDGGSSAPGGSIDPNGFSVNITPACANVTNPTSATTITLTVRDNLGSTATCTSQVTVEDNIGPTITCQDVTINLDANGEFTITNLTVFNSMTTSFTDNCSAAPFNFASGSLRFFDCTTLDTPNLSYRYAIEDQSRNRSNFCTSAITLTDPTLACVATPVAWLSFGANAGAKKVELRWQTSSEPDNAGFNTERSPDGRTWSVIGTQAPLAGNAYRHTDHAPLDGENYYRIRQTDSDGTETFSPVEVVTFTGNRAGLGVFPNPVTDEFTVRIPATFGEDSELQLTDITGRTIQLSASFSGTGARFDAGQLTRGIYLLRAVSGDGKTTETVRIVLQ